jgi:predicted phage-related endonuclease
MGNELEDTVARLFTKRTGFAVRRAPKNYQHKTYAFMRCQVDRLLVGTDELLDCKTCAAWKAKEWEGDEIPGEYIIQVMYQLGITGRSVGWLAVLIGGQTFRYKRIDFDKEMYDGIVSGVVAFWKMVQDKTPPMAIGMDTGFIAELFPNSDEQVQEIESMNDAIALLQETKMHIKELDKTKDDCEAKIKQAIGDHAGIKTSQYVITWKTQSRTAVDVEALKEAKLYDQFTKSSQARVLRVAKNKKGAENE